MSNYLGFKNFEDINKCALRTGGYVDIPRIVSYLKERSYSGRGFEFKHKDKKIHEKWDKFVEDNDFFAFMFRQNRIKSETGACFITINKAKKKGVLLNSVTPIMGGSGVAYSFATPTLAVINQQIAIGNRQVYCRSVYDTEKVVRTFWDRQELTGETHLFTESAKIKETLQIELGKYDKKTGSWTYYHNLGFVPVEVIYNKPFAPTLPMLNAGFYYQSPFTTARFWNVQDFDYSQVKDTAYCGKLILQLDNLYIHMNRLIELYKPRLLITTNNAVDGNPFLQKKLQEQQMEREGNLQDADIFYSNNANKIDVNQVNTPNTIDNYQNQIVATYIDIFKMCGLSWVTQSGTQKTGQESFSQFRGDIEEVNFQRNYTTSKWTNVIIKAFKLMGEDLTKDKSAWSFQVKKNLVTDESSLLDNLIKQYQLKLKTPAQIISAVEGIDEDYAEHIVKDNFKWFKDHKEETTNPEIEYPENANVSGVKSASLPGSKEKGGRPEQKGDVSNEE